MKVLALIPARQGSKRLPGKNIKILGNKPLINWSIDIAKQSQVFCDVIVSTDGEDIASIAVDAGAIVPWLRPAHLASDDARSADVAIHALDWYESVHGSVDALALLQPTSPFRTVEIIKNGLMAFEEFSMRPVWTVSYQDSGTPTSLVVKGNFIFKNGYKTSGAVDEAETLRFCIPNGVLYIISPNGLRSEKSFASGEIVPLFVGSDIESIDIDTMDDWRMAEKIIEVNQT
jgi:CMP-N,N'-diacetyllegionaminic acid synthase